MKSNQFPVVLLSLLSLAACGEPMSISDVKSRYAGQTVSKLTSETRFQHLGPNDPSLGMRYIYHSPDGRAYYFKETQKGYRRRENGKWWAGEDKICYSMRITRAEDVEGDQCAPASTDAAWSTFERGDMKGLAPKRARASSTAKQGNASGTRKCVIGTEAGCSYSWLPGLATVAVGTAAVVGPVVGKLCSGGACEVAASAPSSSSSSGGSSGASSSNSGSSTASASNGVKKIENWGTSPDGSSPQYKITCTNGTTNRYWRQSGEWRGAYGSVGLKNWSLERLANDRCG